MSSSPSSKPGTGPSSKGVRTGLLPEKQSVNERLKLFKNKNFLVYWISGNISWLGDMFSMLAMPLLILNLTDADAAAMGMVMAVSGVPRLVFILFGGVLIDRFSAIKIVLFARYTMAFTQVIMATVCMMGLIDIWMIYVSAVVTGAVGSFLFPAQMTLMPTILEDEELASGNALNNSAHQVLQSFAPMIVGFLIAFLSGYDIFASDGQQGDPVKELAAYGYAFLINSATFIISAIMLKWLVLKKIERPLREDSMIKGIWSGFELVWADPPLRAYICYMAVSQLFMMGGQMVGQPLMAEARSVMTGMPTAAVLGFFGTATGAGAVIGSLVAGFVAQPSAAFYGVMMMMIAAIRGAIMLGLGYATDLSSTLMLFGLFGLFMGYTSVFFSTWMQLRVDVSMLGRMMSVMMFSMMGVAPLSAAFWGWGIDAIGLDVLYYIAGVGMISVAIGGLLSPSMRLLGYTPDHARELLGKPPLAGLAHPMQELDLDGEDTDEAELASVQEAAVERV